MTEPGLGELLQMSLVVPIRSSSGQAVDPARVPVDGMRHGTNESGRFLAAYSSAEAYRQFGPPGSDAIELPAREIFARAEAAGERVVIDPGAPAELEVPAAEYWLLLRYRPSGRQPLFVPIVTHVGTF